MAATETNTTTTLYDVHAHTGGWLYAENVNDKHEHHTYKCVWTLAARAGDTTAQTVTFPECRWSKPPDTTEDDTVTVAIEFDLIQPATRSGSWSDKSKGRKDGTFAIYDGVGALVYTITCTPGDLSWTDPSYGVAEIVCRNESDGSRKSSWSPGKLSLTAQVAAVADAL